MTDFVNDYWAKKIQLAVKQYYLSLPGRTENDWNSKVANNHRAFNLVWRSGLRLLYPNLELNDKPPPKEFRRICSFSSHGSGRNRDKLVIER